MTQTLEMLFPNLKSAGYNITSPMTAAYNCIAWAAHDGERWWWPIGPPPYNYWPAGVPREETMAAFQSAYRTIGFEPCDSGALEQGFEKIAVWAKPNGKPSHAARQLPNGSWSSKLGRGNDIEHAIDALDGNIYGTISCFLRRPANR